MDYPWFDIVSGPELSQGDFLDECPVLEPVTPASALHEIEYTLNANEETYNVIVMSQSCDLKENKVDMVLVCPLWSLDDYIKMSPDAKSGKARKNRRDKLKKGFIIGCHLIDKCNLDGMGRDYQVVDFRNVFSLPINHANHIAENRSPRLRLLPPYREHLSQAFARFFMRVGLPSDIEFD